MLEREPMERLLKKQLGFQTQGFWQCMDTLRKKIVLIIYLRIINYHG